MIGGPDGDDKEWVTAGGAARSIIGRLKECLRQAVERAWMLGKRAESNAADRRFLEAVINGGN